MSAEEDDSGSGTVTPAMGPVATLKRQFRHDKLGLIGTIALVATLVLFVVKLPGYVDSAGVFNFIEVVGQHLYSLVMLLALAYATRTVSLRTLLVYWLIGLFFVVSVTLWIGGPVVALLGQNVWTGAFLLPFFEEALKALPVLVYYLAAVRRGGYQPSAIDGVLLGFAVGAGFAFNEEVSAGRSVGNGFGTLYGILFPTFGLIGGGLFGGPTRWAMGHGGWTALAGLGIGLAFLFRRYWYVSWIPMVGAFALATWDHMMVNYRGSLDGSLDALLLDGNLPIILFLLGLFALIPIDLGVQYYTAREYDRFPRLGIIGRLNVFMNSSPLAILSRFLAAREYARRRRGALVALWIAGDDDPKGGQRMFEQLYGMALAAGVHELETDGRSEVSSGTEGSEEPGSGGGDKPESGDDDGADPEQPDESGSDGDDEGSLDGKDSTNS